MSNKAIPLPLDIIREALELNSSSPTFLRWRIRPRNHFNSDGWWRRFNAQSAGSSAGCESTKSSGKQYYIVCVCGRLYQTHRVVYALANGIDAGDRHIDHIDGNSLNNSPSNLRLATNAENSRNRGKNCNNTSGIKGVYWHKASQKWAAQLEINNRNKHLGLFESINEAAAAYENAARKYHGEFCRP